jgi:hypothetical protein
MDDSWFLHCQPGPAGTGALWVDQLVVFDDGLTGRLGRCSACSAAEDAQRRVVDMLASLGANGLVLPSLVRRAN